MNPLRLTLAAALLVGVASCGPAPIDPHRQIGPNPYLPDIHQYLAPPMHVVKITPWGDATPTVPAGLQIRALARGLHRSSRRCCGKRLSRLRDGWGREDIPRLEDGYVSTTRDHDSHRLAGTFLLKVQFETLPQAAGLAAHDSINSRIVVLGSTKDCLTDLLFVYLCLAPLQRQIADIGEQSS